jgi:hypothetical protein
MTPGYHQKVYKARQYCEERQRDVCILKIATKHYRLSTHAQPLPTLAIFSHKSLQDNDRNTLEDY